MPELKHPDFYNAHGLPMEDLFLSAMHNKGYHVDKDDKATPVELGGFVVPVAVQCFQAAALSYLAPLTSLPLIQLIGVPVSGQPHEVWNPVILATVRTYAQAVAPEKKLFTLDNNVTTGEAVAMASWALELGLPIFAWSFQPEPLYVPAQFNGSDIDELAFFYGCLGVTAVFHEAPDMARQLLANCNDLDGGCHGLCVMD
jgi:glycerophosphoryl diester phosphodiesterase